VTARADRQLADRQLADGEALEDAEAFRVGQRTPDGREAESVGVAGRCGLDHGRSLSQLAQLRK
jgi:hypothetical protein